MIAAADGGTTVYLDRTAFYPTSGGQPHDLGTCNEIEVLDVVDEEQTIAHKLASPLIGKQVHCKVDWTRRYSHMQQHTGQHLLSAGFADLFGYQTVSFHMGAEVSTIELSTSQLSQTETEKVVQWAADLIQSAIPVQISFVEANEAQGLRKLSARDGNLRIVQIGNADRSACGGTHVASTAELGLILTRRQEKLRGHVRLEFVCGMRALHHAQKDFQILNQIARLAGAPIENLPAQFNGLKDRLVQTEKERLRLALELARQKGHAHWKEAPLSVNGFRRVLLHVDQLGEESRAMAQAFTEGGAAALLLVAQNTASVLFAVSSDMGIDAGKILKQALLNRGGRGGGTALLAQGSLPSQSDLTQLEVELGFVLTS